MKGRILKKFSDINCTHRVYYQFLVTDDPYCIYNYEDFCKLHKYNLTWENPSNYPDIHPCDQCKKKCISKRAIKEYRNKFKEYRKNYI